MCSITASKDLDKLRELIELNSYRGTHSHSISAFSVGGIYDTIYLTNDLLYQRKGFGPLDLDEHIEELNQCHDAYFVAHQQAPTTESKDQKSIHPAEHNDYMLWHNGIIKEKTILKLQEELETDCSWDTMLLVKHIEKYGRPNNVDGTFSCILYDGISLSIFRNEISPMFIDGQLNISSTKFKNSGRLAPNIMYQLHLDTNEIEIYDGFETVENPYYFG
jgi:hypothetical protein